MCRWPQVRWRPFQLNADASLVGENKLQMCGAQHAHAPSLSPRPASALRPRDWGRAFFKTSTHGARYNRKFGADRVAAIVPHMTKMMARPHSARTDIICYAYVYWQRSLQLSLGLPVLRRV